MKNKATIRMGAPAWSTTVRGADGKPIEFDHRKMRVQENKQFIITFVRMFREAGLAAA